MHYNVAVKFEPKVTFFESAQTLLQWQGENQVNGPKLFPDTETGENFPQQFVVADSAGDFTQAVLALTQVLGEQLSCAGLE